MNGVAPERTGWRDESISRRHRIWGFDCPTVDVDFILVEYDVGKAVALVEYKHEAAQSLSVDHPSYLAIGGLADNSQIPFFECRYASDFSWLIARPCNSFAEKFLEVATALKELEWVSLLYRIRGRTVPPHVLKQLNEIPAEVPSVAEIVLSAARRLGSDDRAWLISQLEDDWP